MKKVSSGGGWPAILYTLSKAREVGGLWKLWKAMRTKRLQNLRLGMGGQRGGHGQRDWRLSGSLQKVVAGDGLRHARSDQSGICGAPTRCRNCKSSPRAIWRCGRLVEPVVREEGQQYYRPSLGTTPSVIGKLRGTTANENLLVFQRTSVPTKRAFCCNSSRGCTAPTTSTIAVTTAIKRVAWDCKHRFGTATVVLEDLEHADLVFVIGGNPASNNRTYDVAQSHSPPGWRSDCHQSAARRGW